jgi:hypothetical protein
MVLSVGLLVLLVLLAVAFAAGVPMGCFVGRRSGAAERRTGFPIAPATAPPPQIAHRNSLQENRALRMRARAKEISGHELEQRRQLRANRVRYEPQRHRLPRHAVRVSLTPRPRPRRI